MGIAVVLYLVIPLLCMLGIKRREPQGNRLEKDATLAMRGVGMLFIMYTHLVKGHICTATFFFYVSGIIGVAICFLVSGYGLHAQYVSKREYLEHFWGGKLLRLLVPFVLSCLVYLAYSWLAGKELILSETLRSFLTIRFPKTTLWYLKIQLLLYLLFYLAYRFLPRNSWRIAGVFVAVFVSIAVMKWAGFKSFWYNTCLFFPLGLLLAEKQEHILPFARKNKVVICAGAVFVFLYLVIYFFGRLNLDWLIDNIYMLCFCLILLWGVQKFAGFRLLEQFGKYSIEVYLLHIAVGNFDSSLAINYLLEPFLVLALSIPVHEASRRITGACLKRT